MSAKWMWIGSLVASLGIGSLAGVGAERAGWIGEAAPVARHDSADLTGMGSADALVGSNGEAEGTSGPRLAGHGGSSAGAGAAVVEALRAENARLAAEVATLQAAATAAAGAAEAGAPTFTFGEAGRLAGVRETNWAEMGVAAKVSADGVREAAAYRSRGEQPPRDVMVRVQQNVEKLRTYEYAVLDRLPSSAKFNGEFTHPITIANLVAATLDSLGLPLSESQVSAIAALGEGFEERRRGLPSLHRSDALRAEKLVEEMRLKASFLDAFLAVLSEAQRAQVSPPETRNVAGLDLLCPTLLILHTSPVFTGTDVAEVGRKVREHLTKRLSLSPDAAVDLERAVGAWSHGLGATLLQPTPAHRATNYTLVQALEAGERTAALYRELLSSLDLGDAEREALTSDPGFVIPRIVRP